MERIQLGVKTSKKQCKNKETEFVASQIYLHIFTTNIKLYIRYFTADLNASRIRMLLWC